jgi:type IV secretory pathway VirB6-like protein
MFQVVQQVQPSVTGKFLNNTFVHWIPHLPAWLRLLLFWTKKQPDKFRQYSFSARAFENAALAVGNVLTSLLVYGAVTLLYLSTGRALKITAVILLALIVTVCTILFQNHQFVIVLVT